jgi:hypothetical protein
MRVMLLLLIALLIGCTEQQRAKQLGGTAHLDLECGQKLVNATWKVKSLWYLTRPMLTGERPETYRFHESSAFGLLEGTVVIKECAS